MAQEIPKSYEEIVRDISQLMSDLAKMTDDQHQYSLMMNLCMFFIQCLSLLPPAVMKMLNMSTMDALRALDKEAEVDINIGKLKASLKEELKGDKTIEDMLNGKMD